jgi:hypothetical protein
MARALSGSKCGAVAIGVVLAGWAVFLGAFVALVRSAAHAGAATPGEWNGRGRRWSTEELGGDGAQLALQDRDAVVGGSLRALAPMHTPRRLQEAQLRGNPRGRDAVAHPSLR